MKNTYFFLAVFSLGFSGYTSAQDQLSRDYAPIKTELQSWDPVRGEWLAESMLAIARKQPVPDRTFPEDFTPSEMMNMVPPTNRDNIRNTVNANRTAQTGALNGDVWAQMSNFMQTSSCKALTGRSYGDPHLSTFDGKTFSFQTVGEFIYAKSVAGNIEVQTRQRADGDDFSLNTAVAMNVAGDRVCIYADDKPDSDFSNPLRVDGRSIRVSETTYYLAHGGTIRNKGNEYVVTWPTGEKVSATISDRTKFNFMDITTQIYPCTPGGYEGLMGNANGIAEDDINTRNNSYDYASANRFNTVFGGQTATMSNEAEKEYLFYLSKEFGAAWRVTSANTLFDYGPGRSTESYTDFSFPRYHRTVRDLSQTQRDNARRDCENNGISGNELEGCIFDRAYVGLPPSPKPVLRDPTAGVVLPRVQRGDNIRNVNPPQPPVASSVKPGVTGDGVKQPADNTDPKPVVLSKPGNHGAVEGTKNPDSKTPATEPIVKPVKESQPVNQPVKPAPVKENKPVSQPVVKPVPVKESKPAVSEPVKPVPVKESKPVSQPVKPAPVIESKPVSQPVVKPEPVKSTKSITVPSTNSGSVPAPVKTSAPAAPPVKPR